MFSYMKILARLMSYILLQSTLIIHEKGAQRPSNNAEKDTGV